METIYDLRISLIYSSPEIWRLVRCSGRLTLGGLHEVIQMVLEWDDDHLHRFQSGRGKKRIFYAPSRTPFGDPISFDYGGLNEDEYALTEVLPKARMKIGYLYDFGDSWEHEIRVKKVHRGKNALNLEEPRCLDGACASPPDDCGGIGNYHHRLNQWIKSGKPADSDEFWFFPKDFDPNTFDMDAVNKELAIWRSKVAE